MALTGILTEQKLISDCRYRVIESSSLVPVLSREVFSHPYISFFHSLVNGFSVIYIWTDPITLPCSLARAGKYRVWEAFLTITTAAIKKGCYILHLKMRYRYAREIFI